MPRRRSVAVVRQRRRVVVKELRPPEGGVVPRGADSSGDRSLLGRSPSTLDECLFVVLPGTINNR